MRIVAHVFLFALIALASTGCSGDAGADGEDGTSCTVTDNGDGTVTISCEDGTEVTISDGQDGTDGESCTIVDNGDGTKTITCGDVTVTVTDGEDGQPGEGFVPIDLDGVVGVVTDRADELVTGGTIYFVPAADVAALPATTIAVDSTNDEPLEDLIAANASTYQKATIGADGRYALDTLAAGSYFVTYAVGAGDDQHLPGGSLCRRAIVADDIIGTRQDIEVSSVPPPSAEFIGSGKCINCHGKTHVAGTMHRLGIWSPYEYGMLQDVADRETDLWQALVTKFTASGTTVYFYDYDSTRGFDKYKTSETSQATASFSVTVRKNGASYEMVVHNLKFAEPDLVVRVDAVYGGGVLKQRYLTRVNGDAGPFYLTMPLQFQSEGQESATYGRTSKVWRDYYGSLYYDEANQRIKDITLPANSAKSFEKNCISCHANGVRVSGSDTTTYTAELVSDPFWGDFDYDLDGIKDEMNMGCETCHGPGSEHWASAGQGKAIVSPSLLTPEREAMICGQCHSRPKGALATDSPVNAQGWMMRAGTKRSDFLAGYATTQLDGAATDFYGDPDKHSKSHHQQYSDFIRTAMYKNGSLLMTCASCHDPHERANERQLRQDPTDEDALCGGACHATQTGDKAAHMLAVAGYNGGGMASTACVQCHMPKTAKTGAGSPGLLVGTTQYWQNDISSHLFISPDKSVSQKTSPGFDMPTAYTDACGSCHVAGP